MPQVIPFQAANVTVGPTLTLVATVPLAGLDPTAISFELRSATTSEAATADFVIARKLHDAGRWLDYLGGGDFGTATSKSASSSPGPHQLPPGGSAWVDVDCGAAVAIQLWASVASGSAVLSVFGGAKAR